METEIQVAAVQQHNGDISYQVYEYNTYTEEINGGFRCSTSSRHLYSSTSKRKALKYADKIIKAGIVKPQEILRVRLENK